MSEHAPGRLLVLPRPAIRPVLAPGGAGERIDVGRVGELDVLEGRRPLRARGDPHDLLFVANREARRPAGAARPPRRSVSRRSHAVPTLGCPANGISTSGVKIRISARSRSSTKTVSAKPRSAATAWRSASGTSRAVQEHAELVPVLARGRGEDAKDVKLAHRGRR